MNMQNDLLDDAIPRLAVAMQSVLVDAQVQVLQNNLRQNKQQSRIDVRFDGLPTWKIAVFRQMANSHYQVIETQIDLLPLCLASMSSNELQRLAALENIGLRGVTVLALRPDANDGRGGLRIRASFVARKGRTVDEVENLAIDILSVLSFARTLEDRITDNAIAGDFSFELYHSRAEGSTPPQAVRFITTNQMIFGGDHERVFSEVTDTLRSEVSFEIHDADEHSALLRAHDSGVDINVKIPDDIPIFVAHAALMKLENMRPAQVWSLLDELNSQIESGHFEYDPADHTLRFAAWKHLTNDLRHFSFEHAIATVDRAFALAKKHLLPI